MNVRLLRRVKEQILARPRRFDMGVYIEKRSCGTVGCIAGWTCLLSKENPLNAHERAAELLGISFNKSHRLFFAGEWPKKFVYKFIAAKNNLARAKIAAEVIEFFIKTKGTFESAE